MNSILSKDCEHVANRVDFSKIDGAVIVLTGCAGFLGFSYLHELAFLAEKGIRARRVIALDNYRFGCPSWLSQLQAKHGFIELQEFDVVKDDLSGLIGDVDVDYVVHLASIASPTFYRKYPLETIDANVWGLRRLLDLFRDRSLKGALFYSSSEIYGDPLPEHVPTPEDYRGNVACMGPRSCYDEAKRFGETLSYYYHQLYNIPVRIARPFNNYGPGMSIEDKRVVADFAKAVMEGRDIVIHSDGSPTRTFCYIADAMVGYWKVLFHGVFDVFNIGIERPEITVRELADIYVEAGKEILGYRGKLIFKANEDRDYLKDNPQRRCPDIKKARKILGYNPSIDVKEGVRRYLRFLQEGA